MTILFLLFWLLNLSSDYFIIMTTRSRATTRESHSKRANELMRLQTLHSSTSVRFLTSSYTEICTNSPLLLPSTKVFADGYIVVGQLFFDLYTARELGDIDTTADPTSRDTAPLNNPHFITISQRHDYCSILTPTYQP